ncbi:MAG: glycosyltransferase [Lachnospiraceae bacterium]|nr:glycosyltransferase [Lachnospiraceae bacterium]
MRIAIVGHFGGNQFFNDGQTVKTKMVWKSLKNHGYDCIDCVDTYYIKRNPLRFCFQFMKAVLRNRKFMVLLADKGRKVLFPVFWLLSRFAGKEIYHNGIGGSHAIEVRQKKHWKTYLNSFRGNWVESRAMAEQLQQLGVTNALYLPNFKILTEITEEDLIFDHEEPFSVCTFSRVIKEKGIEDAIEAVKTINGKCGRQVLNLDIYGPVTDQYKIHLERLMKEAPGCRYCGSVAPHKSVEVMKKYFLLLFLTFWPDEGFPGTIIDAMASGVPVIARKWPYCEEMLTHGETGYIYPFDQPEQLVPMLEYAITHKEETLAMKKNCLKKADEYREETVIRQIIQLMGI